MKICLFLFYQLNDLLSAKALLTFRADVNSFNPYNQTPLDIAHNKHGMDSEIANLLRGVGGKKFDGVVQSMPDAVELSEGHVDEGVPKWPTIKDGRLHVSISHKIIF